MMRVVRFSCHPISLNNWAVGEYLSDSGVQSCHGFIRGGSAFMSDPSVAGLTVIDLDSAPELTAPHFPLGGGGRDMNDGFG